MPADAGSGGILGDKHLLEASWRVACEGFGARANSSTFTEDVRRDGIPMPAPPMHFLCASSLLSCSTA
jgi:hypothetical protein